ncbi:MAG: hypothetical protein Q4D98_07340 [Planctomycetia bacterium]|nr:hypothetical protein [Planctomycetia bacterium]
MKQILCVAIGLCVACVIYVIIFHVPTSNTLSSEKEVQQPDEIKKAPATPESVARVKSRLLKGKFVTTGRGEDAKWGVAQIMNFQYTVSVIAESEILSKETLPSGYLKVVEKRTFNNVSDSLCVSDVDLQINLKTVPIDIFSQAIDAASLLCVTLSGDIGTGIMISNQNHYWTGKLKEIDGSSLRNLLGLGNIEVPQDIETMLQNFGQARIQKALGGVRNISGKSYLITWLQNDFGSPMYAKFTYSDGTPVREDEELLVLKRVNTFIDSHVAPNPNCKPGDLWNVSVDCLQEVFDPYIEGNYVGSVTFVRREDDKEGFWTMELQPGKIEVVNEQGAITGRMTVNGGYAKVSPKDICLEELYVAGKGQLQKLTPHHWLFTAKVAGECDFEGRMLSVDVLDENPSKTSLDTDAEE